MIAFLYALLTEDGPRVKIPHPQSHIFIILNWWSYCPSVVSSGQTVTVLALWEGSASDDKGNLTDWKTETTRGDDSCHGFVTTSCIGLRCQNTVHLLLWCPEVTKREGMPFCFSQLDTVFNYLKFSISSMPWTFIGG